jgi:hypothetical protein
MSSEIQITPFDFPGVGLSDNMSFGWDVFLVTLPVISIETSYWEIG